MIATVATLVNIFAYLAIPQLGFVTTAITLVFVASRRGRSRLEKLLASLLLTMPLYMIPIIPGVHHIASWSTILMLALVVQTIGHVRKVSPSMFILLFLVATVSTLTGVSTSGADGWYYIVQFLMFVIPAALFYEARGWVGETLDTDSVNRLLRVLVSVQLALALGVLIQWQAHTRLGIELGSVSMFLNRVTYDLTISAYSVLSGVLSVGLVLAPILWRRGRWKMAIILAVASGGAIVVNSSRTGLFVGIAVLCISILFPPKGARKFGARLAIIPAAGLAWWMYTIFESSSRGANMADILDDNGRFDTFQNAFRQMFTDDLTALVGVGYANYQGITPHNFLVETMASSGLIVAACVVLLALGLIIYLRGSEWQYPVWALLGSSMFFAGFYAVKSAAIVAILMLAFHAVDRAETPENPRSSQHVKASSNGG